MPFLHSYLVDADGEYIVDAEGARIIVSSYEYGTTGFDWQRIASSTKKPPFVRSFAIRKFDNGDTWTLTVNQKMFIGIYPSQDAALQVLIGLYIRCNASKIGAEAAITKALSTGQGYIDEALNNLTINIINDDDLILRLSDIDLDNVTTAGVLGVQLSVDGFTWADPTFSASVDGSVDPLEVTLDDGYAVIPENYYYRGVFYDFIGVGNYNIISQTTTKLKDEEDPSGTLSVLVQNLAGDGPPEATWDGSTYTGAAYATPQWTVEDWPQGVSPSYEYAWAYQLDNGPLVPVGGSGSTLNLALVPYGATIKCGTVATAYVNGKVVSSQSPAPMVAVAVSDETTVDVKAIRLFTDLGRTNDVTDNPPADTVVYAYAYSDPAGTQLITGDVTFTPPDANNWEDFSVAQAEINANTTVDFTGRFFRPALGVDNSISVPSDHTITGGTFTAGVELTGWTDEGGGIFSVDIPAAVGTTHNTDGVLGYEYLVDHNAIFDHTKPTTADGATDPVLARYAKGPTEYTFENARSYNSEWWEDDVIALAAGSVVASNDDVITGFRISGATKTSFDSATSVGAATDYVVQFKAGANRIGYAQIGSYDGTDIIFATPPGITYTGYSPFTVAGNSSLISRDREYSISLADNKVYYRPTSGESPTNTFLVMGAANGGGIFVIDDASSGAGGDIATFNNVKMYGTGEIESTTGYGIMHSTSSSTAGNRVRLDGCEMLYGLSFVQSGGWSSVQTDGSATASEFTNNVFGRFKGLGLVAGEGSQFTNNIAMYGEQRSFVLSQNNTNTDAHGSSGNADYVPNKVLFEGNYVFLPCANHGQAISLYAGSYLNADVRHNIIRCMRGALSFQPAGNAEDPNPSSGSSELNIVDNLFTYDLEIDRESAGGQATVAFNSGDDSYLTAPANHTCTVARNLQYIPSSLYDPAQLGGSETWISITAMRLNVDPYENANINIVNNMGFVVVATSDANSSATQGGNACIGSDFVSGVGAVFAATDIGYANEDLTNALCLSDLTPQVVTVPDDSAVEAVGDGASGIRWDAYPSTADLDTLSLTWASTYPATGGAVPSADASAGTSGSNVVDNRAPRPSNFTWQLDGYVSDSPFGQWYYAANPGAGGGVPPESGAVADYAPFSTGKSLIDRSGEIGVYVNITSGDNTAATWLSNNQDATVTLIIDGVTYSALVSECNTVNSSGPRASFIIPGTSFAGLAQDQTITVAITEPAPLANVPDVAAFVQVPHQVTTAASFDLEVVATNVDPSGDQITSVQVDHDGTPITMSTEVMLQYPGTSTDSTPVFRERVTLNEGLNTFTLVAKHETQTFDIIKRTSLNEITVTDTAGLQAAVLNAATVDNTIDVINMNYTETDICSALDGVNSAGRDSPVNDGREGWLTLKPINGNTASWPRDSSNGPSFRPGVNKICFDGFTIGSSTDDEGGNAHYGEDDQSSWIKNSTITAQYDFSYTSAPGAVGDGTGRDAVAASSYEVLDRTRQGDWATNGKKYLSDCTITGNTMPYSGWKVIRDLHMIEHRHDVTNNAGVALNIRVTDINGLRVSTDTDWMHVDFMQTWGNQTTTPYAPHVNMVWAGMTLEATSGILGSDAQTLLMDRTVGATTNGLLIRDIDTSALNYPNEAAQFSQMCGNMTDVLVERMRMRPVTAGGALLNRYQADLTANPPDQPYNPVNVHVSDCSFGYVSYSYNNDEGPNAAFTYENVADAADITSELNAYTPNLSYNDATYHSPIAVYQPTEGVLSDYKNTTAGYRTDSGGTFVNTSPAEFIGLNRLTVYDNSNPNYGLFTNYDSDADEVTTRANLAGKVVTLTITDVNGPSPGTDYVYTWSGDDFDDWTTGTAVLKWATRTDSTPTPNSAQNLYGDFPTYSLTVSEPAPATIDTFTLPYVASPDNEDYRYLNTKVWKNTAYGTWASTGTADAHGLKLSSSNYGLYAAENTDNEGSNASKLVVSRDTATDPNTWATALGLRIRNYDGTDTQIGPDIVLSSPTLINGKWYFDIDTNAVDTSDDAFKDGGTYGWFQGMKVVIEVLDLS